MILRSYQGLAVARGWKSGAIQDCPPEIEADARDLLQRVVYGQPGKITQESGDALAWLKREWYIQPDEHGVLQPTRGAVGQCYNAWKAGHKRVLLCAPTSAGKTEMALKIASDCINRGWRVFFCCDQQNLVSQTVKRFEGAGLECGVVWAEAKKAGMTVDPARRMQVCSIQTMASQMKKGDAWWKEYVGAKRTLWIPDEAHVTAWMEPIKGMIRSPGDSWFLLLTGSPFRLNPKEGLGDVADAIAQTPAYQGLVDLNVPELVEAYRAHGHNVDRIGGILPMRYLALVAGRIDTSGVSTTAGEWAQDELAKASMHPAVLDGQFRAWCEQEERYRLPLVRRPGAGRLRTLAFCVTVEHAHAAAKRWAQGLGLAGVVTGTEATTGIYTGDAFQRVERAKICRMLASGDVRFIASIGAMIKGVDIPEIEVGLCLRATKSLALAVQMTGRIRRPCAWLGKLSGLWLDATANFMGGGLALPETIERFELIKGVTTKRKGSGEAQQKECPACHTLVGMAARVCPGCGHSWAAEIEAEEKAKLELVAVEISAAWPKTFYRALLKACWEGWRGGKLCGVMVPAIFPRTAPGRAYSLARDAGVEVAPNWRRAAVFGDAPTDADRMAYRVHLEGKAARRSDDQRMSKGDVEWVDAWWRGEFGKA